MAVVRTATVTGHRTTGSSTTLGDTATCNTSTTGTDHVAVVFVGISVSTNSAGTTCSVTYGGNAMTQQNLTLTGSTTNRNATGCYTLVNPPTGAQNIVATTAGAATKAQVLQGGGVYSGVGAISTVTVAASLTVAVPSAANGKVIAGTTNANALSAPTQNQLYLDGAAVGGSGDYILVQDADGTGSNVSFSSTGTAGQPNSIGIALNPPNPKTETLTDTFATQDTAKFTYGGTSNATGGQLLLPLDSGYSAIVSTAGLAIYDLTDSYCLIEAVSMPAAGNGTKQVFFSLEIDSLNGFSIYTEGTLLAFREKVANTPSVTSVTYNATTHRWWRISPAGGNILWDTSPTGLTGTWTNQRTKSTTLAVTALYVALASGFYGTEPTPGTAIFDNLNNPPAATTPLASSIRTNWVAMQRANLY